MAISPVHRFLIRSMAKNHVLPSGAAILEIGEANWYGAIDRDEVVGDIEAFVVDADRKAELVKRVDQLLEQQPELRNFDMVKIFYEIFFSAVEVQAIDFEGTANAHKLDLNQPVKLDRRFDVVINHGTAEHIFNVAQVFRTMHEYTGPGGLMVHESPFTGWIDHGFYNFQPTLFFDLADVNEYLIRGMFVEDLSTNSLTQVKGRDHVCELAKEKEIPDNSMLFTVMSKGQTDRPFEVPTQGYYRKSLSESGMTAWRELR